MLSWVGSFTNIASGKTRREGGHNYEALIRKTPKKPIRVFLQDGANDLDNANGNWPLANQQMAKALAFSKYDYQFVFGQGFHSNRHGRAILPDSLRWLWRDYKPGDESKKRPVTLAIEPLRGLGTIRSPCNPSSHRRTCVASAARSTVRIAPIGQRRRGSAPDDREQSGPDATLHRREIGLEEDGFAMPGQHSTIVRNIDLAFNVGTVAGLSDAELVEGFLAWRGPRAEAAFAALVRRHGPMVQRVCRSILRDHHDAQDASQATFLVLARKAGSLRVGDSLGPWLHGVACRVAGTSRAAAARRRAHESRAAGMTPTLVSDESRDDVGPIIHEEIARLPERYRAPVVLCDLEGRTYEEAARCWAGRSGRSRAGWRGAASTCAAG